MLVDLGSWPSNVNKTRQTSECNLNQHVYQDWLRLAGQELRNGPQMCDVQAQPISVVNTVTIVRALLCALGALSMIVDYNNEIHWFMKFIMIFTLGNSRVLLNTFRLGCVFCVCHSLLVWVGGDWEDALGIVVDHGYRLSCTFRLSLAPLLVYAPEMRLNTSSLCGIQQKEKKLL